MEKSCSLQLEKESLRQTWYKYHFDAIVFLLTGKTVHTKMTILAQIAFHGAMHRMLKGAYNSGLYSF